jgi:hypothetical protein
MVDMYDMSFAPLVTAVELGPASCGPGMTGAGEKRDEACEDELMQGHT